MENKFYQKILMDHFKNPRNKKEIENANFFAGQNNPLCGDRLIMTGIIKDNVIKDLGFQGEGCVISQAAASMLTEKCIEKSVEDVLKLKKEDVLGMVGVPMGPNRLRCVLLSLETLQKGIENYMEEKESKKND
jgi:nitrogen fixation NifU-like protein